MDHRDPNRHVGDWVVCTRCYSGYELRRSKYHKRLEDPHDYLWLMGQDIEVERYKRMLRVVEWYVREKGERWLRRELEKLETEGRAR